MNLINDLETAALQQLAVPRKDNFASIQWFNLFLYAYFHIDDDLYIWSTNISLY